ncbi:hypothetical protein N8I77_001039 [Diaporthe amygdali]|uniref:Uncharacterized protein n=1 Tax=Phomopsis amygdali TaxID=1214568 RepID=A0AAD9W7T1_PHOAM|nr:hypothetical protein N8I77_001039 [Diaporthe amygdali]
MGATDEHKEPHRELPDLKTLGEAGDILIKDKEGKEITFKSLYTEKPENERQLIVFVRHFHCGSCKQYVEALVQDLPPEKLSKAKIALTIIGCGDTVWIAPYAEETGCPFPIYADPSVQSYKMLGMMSNMWQGDTRPSYLKKSTLENFMTSTWNTLKSGHPWSSGAKAQNGGEWLFQGGQLKWCHRMRNSTDHTETEELKKVLGLE